MWSENPIRDTSCCDHPLTGVPHLRPGPRRPLTAVDGVDARNGGGGGGRGGDAAGLLLQSWASCRLARRPQCCTCSLPCVYGLRPCMAVLCEIAQVAVSPKSRFVPTPNSKSTYPPGCFV